MHTFIKNQAMWFSPCMNITANLILKTLHNNCTAELCVKDGWPPIGKPYISFKQIFPDVHERNPKLSKRLPSIVVEPTDAAEVESGELRWPPEDGSSADAQTERRSSDKHTAGEEETQAQPVPIQTVDSGPAVTSEPCIVRKYGETVKQQLSHLQLHSLFEEQMEDGHNSHVCKRWTHKSASLCLFCTWDLKVFLFHEDAKQSKTKWKS